LLRRFACAYLPEARRYGAADLACSFAPLRLGAMHEDFTQRKHGSFVTDTPPSDEPRDRAPADVNLGRLVAD
jgi:hypothetical protein